MRMTGACLSVSSMTVAGMTTGKAEQVLLGHGKGDRAPITSEVTD